MKNNGKSDQTKDAQYEELSELQALGEQDLVEELGGAAGFLGNSRPQGIDWRMENMAATIEGDATNAGSFLHQPVSSQQVWGDLIQQCAGSQSDNHGQSDGEIINQIEGETGIAKGLGEQEAFETLTKEYAESSPFNPMSQEAPVTSAQISADIQEALHGQKGSDLTANEFPKEAVQFVESEIPGMLSAVDILKVAESSITNDESTVATLTGSNPGEGVGSGLGASLSHLAGELEAVNSTLSVAQIAHDTVDWYELNSGITAGLIANDVTQDLNGAYDSSKYLHISAGALVGQASQDIEVMEQQIASGNDLVTDMQAGMTTIKNEIEKQDGVTEMIKDGKILKAAHDAENVAEDVATIGHIYGIPGT